VATPVRWEELGRIAAADAYRVATLPRRLAGLSDDPWKGYDAARRTLSAEVRERVADALGAWR